MGQDGSSAPAEAPPDGVIKRRRRSDWTGAPREATPHTPGYEAGVKVASATLASHDGETAAHSDDVVEVSEAIAERLAVAGPDREHIAAVAALHDLGKIAVPPEILRKEGPLTKEEWDVVRRHTIEGERILAEVPEMRDVARLVRHTHERYDGRGYPDGLAADEIPLPARIVFCADAFHAMRCDRPYRPGRPAREALAEIEANAGTQFDPDVATALCEVAADMRAKRTGRFGGSARSRRLAALLVTLTVGGSALAATGAWREFPTFAGGKAEAAPQCVAPCLPADLGRLGKLPAPTAAGPAPAAGIPARSGTGPRPAGANPKAAPRRSAGGVRGVVRRKSFTTPGRRAPARRVAGPAPGAATPSPVKAPTGPPAKARPQSPGRSGAAPRRPGTPVRQGGGAPGRSDEAPGKPNPVPGKFGHKLP